MSTTVQARLDEATRAALDRLVRHHGWSASEVVREGIRLVEERHGHPRRRKLVGIGKFDSGVTDLATNKKYLEDLGWSSMGPGWRPPERGSSK